MFVKVILWFITHLVLTMSFELVNKEMNFSQRNIAATKMISRLIQESEKSTVHVINSNSEIIESFLRSHDLQITVKMENLGTISISENRKIAAMLMQLESYDDFERFVRLVKTELFRFDGYFVIIYANENLQEIERIFSKLWKIYIYNVNVLVKNPTSSNLISMLTYMPFFDQSCNNTNIVQINEFDTNSMKWSKNVFFPAKFKNLNGCLIRVIAFENVPFFIINNTRTGQEKYTGTNVDLVNLLGNELNFT